MKQTTLHEILGFLAEIFDIFFYVAAAYWTASFICDTAKIQNAYLAIINLLWIIAIYLKRERL